MKSYKIQLQVLISVNITFQNFLDFIQHYLKNYLANFPFFNGFTQLHTTGPLNVQNLLSVTNFFCQLSLKCPKHLLCISSELPLSLYF